MISKRLEICLKMTLNKLAIETFIKIIEKFIAFQADDVSRFWNKLFYKECFCSFSSAFMKFYRFFI